MSKKELQRLNADHPEWVELSPDEIRSRYWMYSSDSVARARAEVHLRRILQVTFDALTPVVDAMARILSKGKAHE